MRLCVFLVVLVLWCYGSSGQQTGTPCAEITPTLIQIAATKCVTDNVMLKMFCREHADDCDALRALLAYELQDVQCTATAIAFAFTSISIEVYHGTKYALHNPDPANAPSVPTITNSAVRTAIKQAAIIYVDFVAPGATALRARVASLVAM